MHTKSQSTRYSSSLVVLHLILFFNLFLSSHASESPAFVPKLPSPSNRLKSFSNTKSRMVTEGVTSDNNKNHIADAEAFNKIFSSSVDLKSGYIRNGLATVTRSVRDIDNNKRRSFLYYASTKTNTSTSLNPLLSSIPPMEEPSNIKLRVPSPSGEKVALVLQEKDAKTEKMKQVVEIWTHKGTTLQGRFTLPTGTLHGNICTDTSWFGGFSWRPNDENVIVYVAEQQRISTKSFFDKDEKQSQEQVGGQYTLGTGKKEDWGEKYVDTADLGLFCLSTTTGRVCQIKNTPATEKLNENSNGMDTYTLGQPVFSPCGNSVVYTAWDAGAGNKMPRKLGSIYCYQRSSFLYSSSVQHLIHELQNDESASNDNKIQDTKYECLTPDDANARSARFSTFNEKNPPKIAFLCSPNGFSTHGGCMSLHTFDWDCEKNNVIPNTRRALVDQIRLPNYDANENDDNSDSSVLGMSFPGIFTSDLPQECFSPDGSFVFLTSMWGSVNRVLQISTATGTIKAVPFDLNKSSSSQSLSTYCSQEVICVSSDGLMVSQSSPNEPRMVGLLSPSEIYASSRHEPSQNSFISSDPLFNLSPIACTSFSGLQSPQQISNDILNGLTWEMIISNVSKEKEVENLPPVQSILLLPKQKNASIDKPPPLIVVPHGGPHSCLTTSFIPSYAYLCSHGGYAILLVNYHGSTGFGQDSLEVLAGKVGSLDVKDVWEATNEVIAQGKVDPDRIGICGGSHGGFLTGHMIGQYPELYKVAAMRNPVTNIASMVTATDIPDWAYVETFGTDYYDFTQFRGPTKEELGAMWDASPIAHIQNVVAPTLVALGMMDKRVPPSQGLEYYHSLRSRNIKTKLLIYDKDVHAIDIPVSEADHWINIKQWFDDYLQ